MAVLNGTHGTSLSRAKSIELEGFKPGRGRGGTGTYFWKEGRYAEYLAIAWYNDFASRGGYGGEKEPGCVVIFVKLSVGNTEHLNGEIQSVKDGLDALAEKHGIGESTKELSWLWDLFVTELEIDLRTRYKVIELRVAPPPKHFRPRYKMMVYGAPTCYVVRDPSCVEIESIKEYDHEKST